MTTNKKEKPMYKITDLPALEKAFPQFIKMKKVRTVTEIAMPNNRAIKAAIKLGIVVPGVEEDNGWVAADKNRAYQSAYFGALQKQFREIPNC